MAFDQLISFKINEEMRQRLEAQAEKELLSVSALTRRLIHSALPPTVAKTDWEEK